MSETHGFNLALCHLLPADSFQEGLAIPGFDCPEGHGDPDPVQACRSNSGKIFLGLKDGKISLYDGVQGKAWSRRTINVA